MERNSFLEGWRFGRAGEEKRAICLPHDAMLEQKRCSDAKSGGAGGYFSGGKYEYEKIFEVPEDWHEKDVYIEFEGIYPMADIVLNHTPLGSCAYGYTGNRFLLENLRYGAENTLTVTVNHEYLPDSRWYSGAGIYRPVWLWLGERTHIEPDGVRVTTLSHDPARILIEISHTGEALTNADPKNLQVDILDKGLVIATGCGDKVTLDITAGQLWSHETPYLYECRARLCDGSRIVDEQSVKFGIRTIRWSQEGLFINDRPVLLQGGCIHHDNGILGAKSFAASEWRRIRKLKEFGFNAIRSAHNPIAEATLEACDALGMYVMDEGWDMWYTSKNDFDYATRFEANYTSDIRAIVEKDFNHPSVILYSIGNEITEPANERGVRLGEKLVELFHQEDVTRPVTAGINITLLLMSLMMQGTDFYGSQEKSGGEDAAAHGSEHSVAVDDGAQDGESSAAANDNAGGSERSVTVDESNAYNETIMQMDQMDSTAYNAAVLEMGKRMNMAALRPDADKLSAPILDALDIAGYNYASPRYEQEGGLHPGRVIVGSETFACDLPENWALVKKLPYLIGDFMWTAWDYLGEAGIGAWSYNKDAKASAKTYPWLLADTGAFDILGNDNAEAGLASVVWGARKTPYIGVVPINQAPADLIKSVWRGTNALPSWSYRGCDGHFAQVEVYSDGAVVELLLNGKSLGKKTPEAYKALFELDYEPGELKAVAYDENGTVQGESALWSADGDIRISIRPEGELPDIGEILYVDIVLAGANGEIECNRDTCLSVCVDGGELLGFGSANPRTEESYLDGMFTTYYGRSQAVVRCTSNVLTIRVIGNELEEANMTLTCISKRQED